MFVKPVTMYPLSEGLFDTIAGSTVIESESLLPLSRKISKLVKGQPFESGSRHRISIDVFVVRPTTGA